MECTLAASICQVLAAKYICVLSLFSMDNDTISQVMRAMALRRAAKLSPEQRQAIARKGGQAGKGIKKPRKPVSPNE